MKRNSEFIIQYEGLKIGKHTFDFTIEDSFFEALEGVEVDFSNAAFTVHVNLVRETTMMVFDFEIKGTITVSCDLCLDQYTQRIETTEKLIVNFGDEYNDDNDVILILPRSEYQLDLAPIVYQYIMLAMPWRKECAMDDSGTKACDPVMLQKLSENQIAPSEADEEIDPRWNALKKLK